MSHFTAVVIHQAVKCLQVARGSNLTTALHIGDKVSVAYKVVEYSGRRRVSWYPGFVDIEFVIAAGPLWPGEVCVLQEHETMNHWSSFRVSDDCKLL